MTITRESNRSCQRCPLKNAEVLYIAITRSIAVRLCNSCAVMIETLRYRLQRDGLDSVETT